MMAKMRQQTQATREKRMHALQLRAHSARTSTTAPGSYEVGRSSMERHCKPTRQYKHHAGLAARGVVHPTPWCMDKTQIGDPGSYNPGKGRDMYDTARFTLNRDRKAFNSSLIRALNVKIYGDSVPGPGAYHTAKGYNSGNVRSIPASESAFRSTTPQRPTSGDGDYAGPGAYDPNMQSVFANVRDSGVSFRSTTKEQRLPPDASGHPDHPTCDKNVNVGPGTYESDMLSVTHQLRESIGRQSAKKPGFGTMAPQRALPFEYSRRWDSPDPGAYQPTVWTGRELKSARGTPRKLARGGSRTPRSARAAVKL